MIASHKDWMVFTRKVLKQLKEEAVEWQKSRGTFSFAALQKGSRQATTEYDIPGESQHVRGFCKNNSCLATCLSVVFMICSKSPGASISLSQMPTRLRQKPGRHSLVEGVKYLGLWKRLATFTASLEPDQTSAFK